MTVTNDLIHVLMVFAAVGAMNHRGAANTTITYITPNNVNFTVNEDSWGETTVTYGERSVTFEQVVWSTGGVVSVIGDNINYVVGKGSWSVHRILTTGGELPTLTSGKLNVIEENVDGNKTITFTVDDHTVLQRRAVWNGIWFDVYVELFV